MKQIPIKKYVFLSVLLVLTLTALLFSVSAADTAESIDISDAAARVVITSRQTNETTETLFADANKAVLSIYGQAFDSNSFVKLEFLKPIKDFPYISDINCTCENLVIDLGGFTHEVKGLAFSVKGTVSVRNGTLLGIGNWPSHSYITDNDTAVFRIKNPGFLHSNPGTTLILEETAALRCQDITMIAERASGDPVVLHYHSNATLFIEYGTLINYGQIVGGSSESTAVIVQNTASLYNHGTIAGGNADIAKHYKYGGQAVNGNVVLNTGIIRGGDMTGIASESVSAQGGWGVFGDVEENRGQILGGSANVTIENGTAIAGMAVFGAVGTNSGEIRSGTAVNHAENCEENIIAEAVYETVSVNTGIIDPVFFEQTTLNVFIDGAHVDPQTMLWHNGKEHTVTYTLTFGGKEVTFDDITHRLTTIEGSPVSAIEDGKYYLIVTDGETEKKHPIRIRPAHPFDDITESTPYYADIVGAYQKGLMNGTEPNIFSPDITLSRAMLVTMLWRMEGCPVVNYLMQFSDVPQGEWYSEAIRWAAAEKIVFGRDDGTFGVNDPITLEQMSVMLYRYEQYKGGGFTGMWMFRLGYDDIADISDWAYESICYMVMKDIYCVPAEDQLQPQKSATRAEAAVFLNRYADYRASQEIKAQST